ncbi:MULTISPECIES: hypothetical protein [Hyphomicrobium]|jgi:hypothetical protein|uniref:hypothetical protein n=1 Tax=Hyphomicrobium TaxID=81 RepID=UPI0003735E54|nr:MULTISPECIES: hypothetical protein [Hyphomicrobium]WBT38625.1 hypothetical protein PE058_01780 [Hyphomicrobium sp. DMF-1]
MSKYQAGSIALLTLTLGACAGRAPQIPPLFHATDRSIACDQIAAETKVNNQKISDLATEQQWKFGQNVTAGIVGFMAWPAWLGLDFQDAAGQEARALSQRNEYLLTLAKERCQPKGQIARTAPAAEEDPGMSALASNSEIMSGLVSR